MKIRGVAKFSRQRGWIGLVGILLVLVILGLLANVALQKYSVASTREAAEARSKGAPVGATSASPGGSSDTNSSGKPIERARAVDAFVQKESDEQKRQIDDATK